MFGNACSAFPVFETVGIEHLDARLTKQATSSPIADGMSQHVTSQNRLRITQLKRGSCNRNTHAIS
jgi:hypothetical protein